MKTRTTKSAVGVRSRAWLPLAWTCASKFIAAACACIFLAAAAPTPGQLACGSGETTDMLAAARSPVLARVQAFPSYALLPLGGQTEIGVHRPLAKDGTRYRIIVQIGNANQPATGDLARVDDQDIVDSAITANHALRVKQLVAAGDTLLAFSTPVPASSGWFWDGGKITIIGCGNDDKAQFVSATSVTYTNHVTCLLVTVVPTLVIYFLVAGAVYYSDKKIRNAHKPLRYRRYLDPVVLSSDLHNKGSLSRLQILFFSMIIFFMVFYLLVRVGLLSDMSPTVLELLGISAIGAAVSKATDIGKNRLDYENWGWLVSRGWLPKNGLASENIPSWGDLVRADDGFDVYHFQMLIFSLVVGLALMQIGFTELSTFEVPPSLLAVLGLSQAVYVGGRLVSPPEYSGLNAGLAELRKLEADYAQKVSAGANISAGMTAAPSQYAAFKAKSELVRQMFTKTLGDLNKTADFEPRVCP